MMKYTFKGGIHPYEGKELTMDKEVIEYLPKGDMVYPLSQHIGKPAKPVVKKGDMVKAGDLIAEADGFVSANIHASVSGKVKIIEPRLTSAGTKVNSIVIENDGLYESKEFIPNDKKISEYTRDEIINAIKDAGIVGMGGAGFFGLKLEGDFGIRWLVYCIWSAGEHILLDDRIIECHPEFIEKYHPWIIWGHNMHELYEKTCQALKNLLSGLEILNLDLQEHALKIQLSGDHVIETYQKSEKFPEQAGTGKKRLSYETGSMSDYWLLIYDQTDLHV